MTKRILKDLHKKPGRPRKIPAEAKVEPEKKAGRPRKLTADDTTVKMIGILATAHCTQAEAAAKLGVCENTFVSFLRNHSEVKAAWDEGHAYGRASLRTWQFQAAEAGNTQMLIWLGKQLLGQKDTSKVEQTGPNGSPVQHQVAVTLSEAEREQVKAYLGC